MIGHLTGEVVQSGTNPLLINVHGVGYNVYVPQHVLSHIGGNHQQSMYIHTHVSDDAITLYGFPTKDELQVFTMLLTVAGVGPKTALAVIDRGAQNIRNAIASSDVEFFTVVPRLGKKNAQKIIIELHSKIGSMSDLDLTNDQGDTKQVLDALSSMGFAKNEIADALRHIDKNAKTVKETIRLTLKYLGKP